MTTREYLEQLRGVDRRIADKLEEATKWREVAMSTGGGNNSPDRVQTSKKYDKMGDAVSLAVDFEREANEMARNYAIRKYNIIKQIDDIPKHEHYCVLKDYYVYGLNILQISETMDYTTRQIYRILNDAIDSFEEIYGESYINA